MSLPKYSDYKDSQVEWLGSIPKHWRVVPLKRHARLLTEKVSSRENPIALENIEGWTGRHVRTETDFQGDGVAFVRNDILFGKLRPYLAKVLLAEESGEAVGDFHVLRMGDSLFPRYAQYQMLQRPFIDVLDGSTFGSKMPRASWESLGGMPFAIPEPEEQRLIATFLDRETAKIDALIAEQEKLLALLAEKRQATVFQAVTRGLDSNVPMQASGIPWLGHIPSHWEMRRLKALSPSITVGIVVNPTEYVSEAGLPFLYGGDIAEGKVEIEQCRRIDPANSDLHPKTRLRTGDLVTVRVGAPGVTAVVPPECDGGNCASMMLMRRGDFSSEWLCFAMNSRVGRYQVEVVQYGAAQEQFNIGHAINFWLPTPPRDEQERLAIFLEVAVNDIERLQGAARESIALLVERRSALIAAAVTGQIDVRTTVASVPLQSQQDSAECPSSA